MQPPAVPGAVKDADERFRRTVQRIGAEAFWLRTYQAAINGMQVDAIGLDFFRVSLNALKDARLIRLMRVLEDDSQTASFWYLLRVNPEMVKSCALYADMNLEDLADIARRLKNIRDKTFVHIDKDGVFDPQRYYEEAGIKNDKLGEIIDRFWIMMQAVHRNTFATEIEHDHYTGQDIRRLADLRDASA